MSCWWSCTSGGMALGARALLHIPANLQTLIAKYGRAELLRDSEAVLLRLRRAADPAVMNLVRMLDETGCGLEQEALLLGGSRSTPFA